MKILILSDKIHEPFYSNSLKDRYPDVEIVLSCGDLPYSYLEYFIDALNVPLFFVRGNHGQAVEYSQDKEARTYPWGAEDLHERVVHHAGLIFVGFDGCVRYRAGAYQHTQFEMWLKVLKIVPRLWINRLFHGRYFDVLISHAPPWGVNDQDHHTHQGFKAFRWLIKNFKPRYHFHGHVHIYDNTIKREAVFEQTEVVNAYNYYFATIEKNEVGKNE